jgi:hypothetical protein
MALAEYNIETDCLGEVKTPHTLCDYLLDKIGKTPSTWLRHEIELKHHSKSHPEVLFTLHIVTSETEWKKYFLNGKVQRAEAYTTFPSFNRDKLK